MTGWFRKTKSFKKHSKPQNFSVDYKQPCFKSPEFSGSLLQFAENHRTSPLITNNPVLNLRSSPEVSHNLQETTELLR
ncbi:hypothetical protein [Chryseobacterium sp. VD8]|uniref:hypothetical protein n=1 Tax=Chryseobacterium sp. VD8 TaxID=3081254 RepID=UPI003019B7F3